MQIKLNRYVISSIANNDEEKKKTFPNTENY